MAGNRGPASGHGTRHGGGVAGPYLPQNSEVGKGLSLTFNLLRHAVKLLQVSQAIVKSLFTCR